MYDMGKVNPDTPGMKYNANDRQHSMPCQTAQMSLTTAFSSIAVLLDDGKISSRIICMLSNFPRTIRGPIRHAATKRIATLLHANNPTASNDESPAKNNFASEKY